MESQNSYPCRCCGYLTLTEKPPGTYLICPICFWEDNNEEMNDWREWMGSNQVSLRQAQRNFLEFGACELEWLNDVRPPTGEDVRCPDWETIEVIAKREALLLTEQIREAFIKVNLEDGITLHEARARDDYEDTQKARMIDSHLHWIDIPDSWIEKFHDIFILSLCDSFMQRSFRERRRDRQYELCLQGHGGVSAMAGQLPGREDRP